MAAKTKRKVEMNSAKYDLRAAPVKDSSKRTDSEVGLILMSMMISEEVDERTKHRERKSLLIRILSLTTPIPFVNITNCTQNGMCRFTEA